MTKFDSCLKWFSGKPLENAKVAVAMLAESEADGAWLPKHSVKVRAALSKCNVAKKWAVKNIGTHSGVAYDHPLRDAWHAMFFGSFSMVADVLAATFDADLGRIATVKEWAMDFLPVAEAIERLDATRPKPVYFMKTLSATVLGNVAKAMGVDLTTLRVPDMEWKLVEKVDAKGKKVYEWECEILWPEGTKHNTSKFARGCNCHACGHLIMNPFNWVPILADTPTGPVSLWTGKDCAKNLFGCDVKHEVAMPGSPASKE